MAWDGVPFLSDADFQAHDWPSVDFINQFITAMDDRNNVMGSGTTTPVAAETDIQAASWYNGFRSLSTIGNMQYFVGPEMITAGTPIDDVFYFDGSGNCTQAFVDRVNAILTDAGCGPMGSAPLGSGGGRRIPYTRKFGDRSSPTIDYGEMEAGDLILRHVWNEWWAVVMALDAIDVQGLTAEGGAHIYNTARQYGESFAADADCATARSSAESDYAAASTSTTNTVPRAIVTGDHTSGVGNGFFFTGERREATKETASALGSIPNLSSVISCSVPDDFGDVSIPFYDLDDDGKVVGEIHEVNTDSTPGAGVWTSPTYGNLDNPLSSATHVPCPSTDTHYSKGYILDVYIFAVFEFPDP